MRLDRANRGFVALAALGLLAASVVLWGALGDVLMPLALAGGTRDSVDQAGGLLASGPFVALLLAGIWRAGRVLAHQLRCSRELARRVDDAAAPPPPELELLAAKAGLDGRVLLLEEAHAVSFVYGLLNPRIAVSRGLLQCVSDEQLRAVLEHERYHVRNLDPLKGVLARTLAAALFLLPVLEGWRVRYLADRELAADRLAIAACGRRPLAEALLHVFGDGEREELQAAAAFGAAELIDARVAQLENAGGRGRLIGPRLARSTVGSLLGAALLGGAFMVAVLGFGGPGAVLRATGSGLTRATLLGGLACGAPLVLAAALAYLLLVLRARPTRGSL